MTSLIYPNLILASSSNYRQQLLSRLPIPFQAISPNIDETPLPHESPSDTALRLAKQKALVIAHNHPNSLIIGSDQVATLNEEKIGKPGNFDNALIQLTKMQGQCVQFHTALCLVDNRSSTDHPHIQLENIITEVHFRTLPKEQLIQYLHLEKPYDCAGSAKNEGLGITLIEKIKSEDPTALTGLPLIALTTMLMQCKVVLY